MRQSVQAGRRAVGLMATLPTALITAPKVLGGEGLSDLATAIQLRKVSLVLRSVRAERHHSEAVFSLLERERPVRSSRSDI